MARGSARDAQPARHPDVQGQGRARGRDRHRGGTAVREALPESELYVDANRGWSYEAALRRARRSPSWASRRSRSRSRWRTGAGVRGSRSAGSSRWSATSPASASRTSRASSTTARSAWSASRSRAPGSRSRGASSACAWAGACRWSSARQYEGGVGALATVAFASAFAGTARRPAEATNFLDLADDLLAEPPEIADGRMAPRPVPASASRSTRTALDALPDRPMRFMVEMTVTSRRRCRRATPSCSPASASYSQALQRAGRWEHLWRVAGATRT